jgi:hypothetical protein
MSHESTGASAYTDAASNQMADAAMLYHQEPAYLGHTVDQMDSGLRELSTAERLDKFEEDRVTSEHNLPDVNLQLDEIDENIEIMKKLSDIDDSADRFEGSGRLIYEHAKSKENRPRLPSTEKLKRALFVVEKVFGIDTEDRERVQIERGYHYTKNMESGDVTMVKNSYYRVTIPELNAVLFVANHRNRSTFVFNKQELDEYYSQTPSLIQEDNLQFGQTDLSELMETSRNTGSVFRGYRANYQLNVETGLGSRL